LNSAAVAGWLTIDGKGGAVMSLWLALVLGVVAWTPIAFLLSWLLGRCMRDCDEPVDAVRTSGQGTLPGPFIADEARRRRS
jgi:hypothetical protein